MSPKLAALVICGSAGIATAAAADFTPGFSQAPTVAEVAAAYPARAKAAGVSGAVLLTCEVGRDNHPRECAPLKETPGAYGFGVAARKLAETMVVDTPMAGRNIFIPVNFDAAILKGEATVTKPIWAEMPAIQDVQASFPKTQNGVNNVRVVLGCKVEAGGALSGCSIAQEDPPGQGYGAGALSLASKFRVAPWAQDGSPTIGAQIRLPIRYALTPEPAAAKTP
jgi:hypothetical protein